MKPALKQLVYNLAQLAFIVSTQAIKILEWGRGTGKSTILGRHIRDCVAQLPRSSGALVAETYTQILTRTLPSTIAGLEQHGLIKDLHYFVGRKPPKSWNWPEPYEPPLDYKRCIIFWNGTVLNFISQDSSSGSGRGLNIDWIVGDEAARLDKTKFETDVLLTNRGNKKRIAHYPDGTWKYYGDCPLHHSIVLATSTPVTVSGRWILDYEAQALLHPDKVAFIRASAEVNRMNLGDEYFDNAKAVMPDFLYDAEVKNIRMKSIENSFYPKLDEAVHCYNNFNYDYYNEEFSGNINCLGDKDLDRSSPLILGIDWGAKINCLVVAQNFERVELKFLKNFFVKSPEIIEDLIKKFTEYYKHHECKEIYLYYDPTGNNRQANSRLTYAQEVKKLLESAGWSVSLMTGSNHNVLHSDKYKLWNNVLTNIKGIYPEISFNKSNCLELWVSMINAPSKEGFKDEIRKDKSSERSEKTPQEHATHFSDAADVIIVGLFLDTIYQDHEVIETLIN